MKMKRIWVAVLAICILSTGIMRNTTVVKAEEGSIVVKADEGSPLTYTGESTDFIIKPGETINISLPIKTASGFIFSPTAKISDRADSPFTFTKPVLNAENGLTVEMISSNSTTYVNFQVKASETASIKTYPVSLIITGLNLEGSSYDSTMAFNLKIMEEKAPAQLTVGKVSYGNSLAGSDTELSFIVKNEGELIALNTFVSIDYGNTGITKRYTAVSRKIGDIEPGKEKTVTVPISILPTAEAGTKTLVVKLTYKDQDGIEYSDKGDNAASRNIMIEVKKNTEAPYIDIENIIYPERLKPGDEFVLVTKMKNIGDSKAGNIKVSVENTETDSIVKNYYTDSLKIEDLKQGGSAELEIPLVVGLTATGNMNKVSLKLTYTDSMGVSYTNMKTLYLKVTPEATVPEKEVNIIVSNVSQKPSKPVAGGELEVSFDIYNKGTADIKEMRIALSDLSGNTFIPVNSEPYIYIEQLNAGETKRITIPLKVSEVISEGLNKLSLSYTYKGMTSVPLDIPVLNVQNDLGSSSIPKLILSKYVTDTEVLKAGSVFNLIFDIKNTHSSVSAKNITITVKPGDVSLDVFPVTQGSNSFYVDKIAPGETIQLSLEMKVKSDTKTGGYKYMITADYEYDGIKPNEKGDIGITQQYELNLQAIENARPEVNTVNIYSYDGNITTGNPINLSFDFYNMGKSTLNNVVARVEGDFAKTDGGMYFLGNVASGESMYHEFEVMSNVEGIARGVLVITYEDSNGDEVEYRKEFEQEVMGMTPFDPGSWGGDVDVFNPEAPVAKKEIVKPWLFILIQVLIFIIFLPVTRKIIISIHRRKLQRREEAKY